MRFGLTWAGDARREAKACHATLSASKKRWKSAMTLSRSGEARNLRSRSGVPRMLEIGLVRERVHMCAMLRQHCM